LVAELFRADKRKLTGFCENVEAAFGLKDPDKYNLFYKYIRMHITGKAMTKLHVLFLQDAED
jgi:hypothetical protein